MNSTRTVVVTRARLAWVVGLTFGVLAGIAVILLAATKQAQLIGPSVSILGLACAGLWALVALQIPKSGCEDSSLGLRHYAFISGIVGWTSIFLVVMARTPRMVYLPAFVVWFLAFLLVVSWAERKLKLRD